MNRKTRQTEGVMLVKGCSRVVKTLWSNIQTEKQILKVKTEDPLTYGRSAIAGRGSNDFISNHIYYSSIFYFCYVIFPLNVFLPIEFCDNSISDKCNVYYVVHILHSANLLLIMCICLLDFPIFVGAPSQSSNCNSLYMLSSIEIYLTYYQINFCKMFLAGK